MDGTYFYILAAVTAIVLCITFLYIIFSFFWILYKAAHEKDKVVQNEVLEQTETNGGTENVDQAKLNKQRLEQLCINLEAIGLE